jgi:hypothetical protein
MTRLTIAALVGVFALSGTMAGQDATSQAEQITLRLRADEAALRLQIAKAQNSLKWLSDQIAELSKEKPTDVQRAQVQRDDRAQLQMMLSERVGIGSARLQDLQQRLTATVAAQNAQCALPDGTTYPVERTVTFRDVRYQCVEVLDANLSRSGVGWTRLAD